MDTDRAATLVEVRFITEGNLPRVIRSRILRGVICGH